MGEVDRGNIEEHERLGCASMISQGLRSVMGALRYFGVLPVQITEPQLGEV